MKKPITELDAQNKNALAFLEEHLQEEEGTGKVVLKESPDGFFDNAEDFKKEFVFDSREEADLVLRRFARYFVHGYPTEGKFTTQELRWLKLAAKESIAFRKAMVDRAKQKEADPTLKSTLPPPKPHRPRG